MKSAIAVLALAVCVSYGQTNTNTLQRQIITTSLFSRQINPLETAADWRAKLGLSGGGSNTLTSIFLDSLTVTNGITNLSLIAHAIVITGSDSNLLSLANALGALTNDGAGNIDWYPGYATQPGSNLFSKAFAFPTNATAGPMADFSLPEANFSTNSSFNWLLPVGVDTARNKAQWTLVTVTNSSGSPILASTDASVNMLGSGWITNLADFWWRVNPGVSTNCYARQDLPVGLITNWADTNSSSVVSNIVLSLATNVVTQNPATGPQTFQSVDNPTNTWAINSNFGLGTNSFLTSGAATGGITGLANKPTSTERYGQLVITASGDLIFTNPASFKTSDFLSSRTITNGNSATIAVDFVPGQVTNLFIVQTK